MLVDTAQHHMAATAGSGIGQHQMVALFGALLGPDAAHAASAIRERVDFEGFVADAGQRLLDYS